jgi:hypothetical protein
MLVAFLLCSAPPRPALRIGFVGGVSVTGVLFAPRERVEVTFASAGTWRRSIRTTATGRFSVTLEGASVDRCQGYFAIARGARGARGDTASLKVMPLARAPE